ncbi:putative reverse transcriptase domain-containing protein [Tanacetum coccineum]
MLIKILGCYTETDNERVNMLSFSSLELTVNCLKGLDFFNDFENEFLAIVYNDALTSKLDFLTEPTLSLQHIDDFDLKDETSLSEYDEVKQNVLYFNDLFSFNIIYPDDLKSDKDNDDNEIDIIQSSGAYSYGASHINKSIPRKEKDPGSFTLPCYINNVCFDNALADLGASVSVMPLSTYLNLGLGELSHTKLIVELADRTVKYPKGTAKNVLVGIGKFVFLVDFIILDMSEDIKVPLILGRQFLSIAHAKIDVFKRKITLRVGEEKIIFKSVKPASSLIKRVYMLSLREMMELDLEAMLIGETLVLNRSLDPLFRDYIELNDINVPLEIKRDQVDDLMPTIEEGEVVEKFRAKNDARMVSDIFGYPSDCDHYKKIHIDCAHNLKFSCMIGLEFLQANFFPILYVNVMSKNFYNSIWKYKLEYKGNNVVGALMNIPIFVGTFSILTDFAVLEDMDAYRDEGMGNVIFGEPFLREVGINARRFKGMITIYNSNEEVTYQMVRSHPRPRCKEIDNVGEVSTIWKSISVGVLKFQDVIMKYLVKISKKACILEVKQRNMKKSDSDIQYVVSIKEDTAYLCLHFTKDHEGNKIQYVVSRDNQYAVFKLWK